MNKNDVVLEILKYVDCFGTHFNFYSEKKRKFYTAIGGVLTIFSVIVGFFAFVYINFDDFLHDNPITTSSTSKEPYRNVRFFEEKIWIPWRIRDFYTNTFNFTGIFHPIIYYYQAFRNGTKNNLEISYDILNYKLCNETSMKNYTDTFILDIELEKLYCIDMEDINIGGSWNTEYINYVQFDLFACNNGIDYDENNKNCTKYDRILELAGENNGFSMDLFFPVVHYQPMNKTNPIIVKYDNFYYRLSKYSNKIDKLYLQQYILKDDTGYFIKNEKTYTHWGIKDLTGDNYANGDGKDLLNEGSSSRLYSLKIFLKFDTMYYKRYYKNMFLIIADGLPIVNGIFSFFKLIAKIFKVSSENQKLMELLFENLQKKPLKNKQKLNLLGIKKNNYFLDKKMPTQNPNVKNNLNNMNIKNYNYNLTSLRLTTQNEKDKCLEKSKDSIESKNESTIFQNMFMSSKQLNNIFNRNNEISKLNNFKNMNVQNNNINDLVDKDKSSIISPLFNVNCINNYFVENKNNNKLNNNNDNQYIKSRLFPYKYYLCTIFIKNLTFKKNSIFFSKKFIDVYNFICQLIDISSYLILQREFEILKNTLMIGKQRDILENKQKINVNDHSFQIDMKECLKSQKFSILGRRKNE